MNGLERLIRNAARFSEPQLCRELTKMQMWVLKIGILLSVVALALSQPPLDWAAKAAQGKLLFSEILPVDTRVNATIGNGFLSTSVGSDTVYISGLFNGESSESPSHRARIPGYCAVTFSNAQSDVGYALDLEQGVFKRRAMVGNDASMVEQRFYASRNRRNLIIVDFALLNGTKATLDLEVNLGSFSQDLFPTHIANLSSSVTLQTFRTLTAEDSNISSIINVALVSSTVPSSITLTAAAPSFMLIFSFSTTLEEGDFKNIAVTEFKKAQSSGQQVSLF